MTSCAQLALLTLLSVPLIAFTILARGARLRIEQSRDDESDWLRAACSTFHRGAE